MKLLHGSSAPHRAAPAARTLRLPVWSVLDVSRLPNWPITLQSFVSSLAKYEDFGGGNTCSFT